MPDGRASNARALALALALGTGALPAAALTLQPSVFQEMLYAGGSADPVLFHALGTDDAVPESFVRAATVTDASAEGHVFTLGGALPRAEGAVSFTAIGNPTRSLYASFDARVYYEWGVEQVGGAPTTDPVPVRVRAQGGVDSRVNAGVSLYNLYAQASFGPRYSGVDHAAQAKGCQMGSCTYGPIGFDESFAGQAVPDSVYTVVLHAFGSGYLSADGSSFTISAWADPRIEIDPTFARRDDFRIVYGAGVTPVPEPSVAALMLVGLLGLGAAGSLRRTPWRCRLAGQERNSTPSP